MTRSNRANPEGTTHGLLGRTVADRYRILRVIAEGGMGVVYEAEQSMGEGVRKVAIKTLLPELSQDHIVVSRFTRECAVVASLEHPNTVRVYDFGKTTDGILYIAMEYVHGRPLGDVLAEGKMALPRALAILEQISLALNEAHELGIVHRDLKPDNVVLSERAGLHDFVKLLDFGIAMRISHGGRHDTKLTQQGMVLGTPPYMSPEQFTAEVIDKTSDVYSLAVIAYEMLNGKLPFDAETPWQWAHHHLSSEPAPFAAEVPLAVANVVLGALSKQRQNRPQTTLEFYRQLAHAAGISSHRLRAASTPNLPTPGTTGVGYVDRNPDVRAAEHALSPNGPNAARRIERTEPSLMLGAREGIGAGAPMEDHRTASDVAGNTEPGAIGGGATEPGALAMRTGGGTTGTAPDVRALKPAVAHVTAVQLGKPGNLAQQPNAPYFHVAPQTSTRTRKRPLNVVLWSLSGLLLVGGATATIGYIYYAQDQVVPLPPMPGTAVPDDSIVIAADPPLNEPQLSNNNGPRRANAEPLGQVHTGAARPPINGTVASASTPAAGTGGLPAVSNGGNNSTAPTPVPTSAPASPFPFQLPFPLPTSFPMQYPLPTPPAAATPGTPSPATVATSGANPGSTPSQPSASTESCNRARQLAASDTSAAIDQYELCRSAAPIPVSRMVLVNIVATSQTRAVALAAQGRCQDVQAIRGALARVGRQSAIDTAVAQTPCPQGK